MKAVMEALVVLTHVQPGCRGCRGGAELSVAAGWTRQPTRRATGLEPTIFGVTGLESFPGVHRGVHAPSSTGSSDTNDPLNHAVFA
jgi:hypothetical protein